MHPPSQSPPRAKPWFGFGAAEEHVGDEPAYYDAEKLAWPLLIEAHWTQIRDEFAARFGDGRSLETFFDEAMINRHGAWKTHSLYVHGLRYHKNLESFPRTDALLRQIPGLVSASFSWLDPPSEIKPHHGDSNMIVRGHLGLVVPAGLPACGLEVDGEQRGWETGRMLLFCDAYIHRAWNLSSGPRLVMIIDVMLAEHRRALTDVCSQVLGSLLIFRIEAGLRQRLGQRASQTLPAVIRMPLHKLFARAWSAYLPIQPRLRWLPPR